MGKNRFPRTGHQIIEPKLSQSSIREVPLLFGLRKR